jgi:hypothetical protein
MTMPLGEANWPSITITFSSMQNGKATEGCPHSAELKGKSLE